jgi:hypothetical protein
LEIVDLLTPDRSPSAGHVIFCAAASARRTADTAASIPRVVSSVFMLPKIPQILA